MIGQSFQFAHANVLEKIELFHVTLSTRPIAQLREGGRPGNEATIDYVHGIGNCILPVYQETANHCYEMHPRNHSNETVEEDGVERVSQSVAVW